MTIQGRPDVLSYPSTAHMPEAYVPEAHVRVRGAYTAPDPLPLDPPLSDSVRVDSGPTGAVLRATQPISAELGGFVLRHLAGERDDGADPRLVAAVYTLDALLAGGVPWPVHLAVHLLRRIADVLDAADAAGVVLGTFTPRCVALDGPYLVLAPGEDPDWADPAYVAPEQREPGAAVDARASQYGLALLAATLLSPGRGPAWLGSGARSPTAHAGLSAAVQRLVLTARDPHPARRFSRAGDFVTALEAACAESWQPGGGDGDANRGAPWRSLAPPQGGGEPRQMAHRLAGVGALVGVAVLAGAGAGWYAARQASSAALPPRAARSVSALPVPPAPASRAATARAASAPVGGAVAVTGPLAPSMPSPVPLPRLDSLRAPPTPAPGLAPPDRPPSLAAQRLGALATSVVLPSAADLVPNARRVVASPVEFAASGLIGPGNLRAATADAPPPDPVAAAVATTHAEWVAGARPRYPASLLSMRVGGEVVARYVVDSQGHVDPRTVAVVRSDHQLFEEAVRESLRQARFRPAESEGGRMQTTVEQTFRFAPPR